MAEKVNLKNYLQKTMRLSSEGKDNPGADVKSRSLLREIYSESCDLLQNLFGKISADAAQQEN
ncbi:MAG: hypothetical protein LBT45_02375 [Rickettsiales bacterium]|jgi:hypothetical protein|nr:hypothetical protein [Rickettsiales bacterium]